MNPVDPINGFAYYGDKPVKAKSDLDMETFMRLLTVQLANQNPLEPMNDRDFFAQMAQLGQVEGLDKVEASISTLQASGLIGKEVTALRPMTDEGSGGENSLVNGIVTRMTIRDGKHILGVQEPTGGIVEVQLANVREIRS